MKMSDKRSRALSECLAKYRRNQISKEQYLNQHKLLLQEEMEERDAVMKEASRDVARYALQLEEIEQELLEIAEQKLLEAETT